MTTLMPITATFTSPSSAPRFRFSRKPCQNSLNCAAVGLRCV
ncbi:MAG: hypothetical protein U0521_00460 [Anaerolineae bacterium]